MAKIQIQFGKNSNTIQSYFNLNIFIYIYLLDLLQKLQKKEKILILESSQTPLNGIMVFNIQKPFL